MPRKRKIGRPRGSKNKTAIEAPASRMASTRRTGGRKSIAQISSDAFQAFEGITAILQPLNNQSRERVIRAVNIIFE
jgi:hypothetical protein